ncbi:hypothetical protein EUTSA_v100241181mg, partial [Eutrema salsugineum]
MACTQGILSRSNRRQ